MLTADPLPMHPRLLAAPEDWARLRAQVETDQVSRQLWVALRARAEQLLTAPPVERRMTGRRLLLVSREALDRIGVLSLVANISGEQGFAQRAIAEMRAVISFEDWNPGHFLDVAEMALAVAIGYDWLHAFLSEDERKMASDALVEKALKPSLDDSAPHNRWIGATTNWAQVCHGGLSAAAIAIADREPELADAIIGRALERLPGAATCYAPDGVYPEGPMYWAYGTSFHVILAAALTRLSGEAQGLDAYRGFARSAEFVTQATAPSGDYFNYADCRPRRRLLAPLWWMARRFRRGDWLAHELAHLERDLAEYRVAPDAEHGHHRLLPLILLWRDPSLAAAEGEPVTHWFGRGTAPISVLRSRDGRLYAAIKGGSAGLGHAHMDAGSFVIEADGVRWAVDPGMQEYESLEQAGVDLWNMTQESQRWSVFRLGPDAHSILRFDGLPQLVSGNAQFKSDGALDLAPVYADRAARIERRLSLVDDAAVLIEDAWEALPGTGAVSWQWMTEAAAVDKGGGRVRLRQNGATMMLRVLEPAGAMIEIADVSVPRSSFDASNPGLKRIRITVPASAGRLRVLATPARSGIASLIHWLTNLKGRRGILETGA